MLEEGLKFQILICDQPRILIDDYGHHPVEISATIQAIRQKFPRKKICMILSHIDILGPNNFLMILFKFFQSRLLITFRYISCSEKPIKGISSKKLISGAIKKHKNAEYLGKTDPLIWLQSNYKNFSILITQCWNYIKTKSKIKNKWQ